MYKKKSVLLVLIWGLMMASHSLFAKGREPLQPVSFQYNGWVVYWDLRNSLKAALDIGEGLEEISLFAADFDEKYNLTVYPEVLDSVPYLKRLNSSRRPRLLLAVVNDVKRPGGALLKNPDIIHDILSSPKKREAHINQLLDLSVNLDGIEIDYESLYLKDREAFSIFIKDLANKLHQRGQWLSVDVEPKTEDVLKDREGAMDWKVLGQHADHVKVMAYLYHYPSGDPGPLAPPIWVSKVARFALSQIPPEKLSIVLTMNGIDWAAPGRGKAMNYSKIMRIRSRHQAVIQRDQNTASPYFSYTENGSKHEVWFEDRESLREKVRQLQETGIKHIGLWYLGSGDPAFLKDLIPQ